MNTNKLKKIMNDKNVSPFLLSKKSGVAYSTIHDLLNNKSCNPRIETIKKIVETLEVKFEDVLEIE